MTQTAKIEIERVARDCDFNRKVESGEYDSHRICDFYVMINGEHRATFKASVWRGYDLYDIDSQKIKYKNEVHSRRADVRAQENFTPYISELMTLDLIPTIQEIEQRREENKKRAERIEKIKNAGPELLEALKWILKIADLEYQGDKSLRSQGARTLDRIAVKAEEAIAKVEQKVQS